jgi:hypothetical protein
MRYGYYIPTQDLLCGDLEFATEARENFRALALPCDKHGNYQGNRYDGFSIYVREDGTLVKRLTLQNFFNEKRDFLTIDS